MLPGVVAVTLLNGRFETTTDVQYLLDLALDVAAMREATTMAGKAAIYQNVGTLSELPHLYRSKKLSVSLTTPFFLIQGTKNENGNFSYVLLVALRCFICPYNEELTTHHR